MKDAARDRRGREKRRANKKNKNGEKNGKKTALRRKCSHAPLVFETSVFGRPSSFFLLASRLPIYGVRWWRRGVSSGSGSGSSSSSSSSRIPARVATHVLHLFRTDDTNVRK